MPSTRTGAVAAGRAKAGGWGFFRRWLLYFVPWAVVIQLALGFYYQIRSQQDLAAIEAESAALTRTGTTVLAQVVQRAMSDLLVLANAGDFAAYAESGALPPTLGEAWIRFLRIKRVYDQIRFIDLTGREVLRVDYQDGQPVAVAAAGLQNQAQQPYFRAASRLARGEFHISPFDLEVAGGAVELPIKPTIRFVLPVFDRRGQRRGVLVLNYQGQDLLSRLSAVAAPDYAALMLLNAQGYWLHGAENAADAWAFMFGRPITLATRYPGSWATLLASEAGRVRDRHGLWAWTTFRPALAVDLPSDAGGAVGLRERPAGSDDGEFWKVVSRVPAERLDQLQHERRRDFVLALALGLLGLVLVAWRLAEARQRQKVAEGELRALNQTLESQVNERTKRLQNEIFDRQMAERRYRESSEQYQHMVATTVDGFWLLDGGGGLLDANQAACRMLGVTREIVLGMSVDELGVGEPGGSLKQRMAEVMLAGSERFETRLRRADDSEIDVEISASYLPEY
ncbi:MAG TPA: PAS domain S-box protein, partial [Rhodocyclaceae bacterium]|nr:PAS domain S-box protein [Rhodocyclaceae bacterium]